MARRPNDFYPTPKWATRELLRHVNIGLDVLECCAGDGAIADVLETINGAEYVHRNDIDNRMPKLNYSFDATDRNTWVGFPDWVVTNPPFSCAPEIIPIAYDRSRLGIAMLLRLSFLEPVENRGAWLNGHPPTTLIVLPRISFTGDGKTDNVTCAWMVWDKRVTTQRIVVAKNPKFATSATGSGG